MRRSFLPFLVPGAAQAQFGRFIAPHQGPAVWVFAEVSQRCLSRAPVEQWVEHAARVMFADLGATIVEALDGWRPSQHRGVRAYATEALAAAIVAGLRQGTADREVDQDGVADFLALSRRLSSQREEGHPPAGRVVYLDRHAVPESSVRLRVRLAGEQPPVRDTKHVGKLLAGGGGRWPLVVRGSHVVGYGEADLHEAPGGVHVDFTGRVGLLRQHGLGTLAVVKAGTFLGSGWDRPFVSSVLAEHLMRQNLTIGFSGPVANVAFTAGEQGHGATVLVDVSGAGQDVPGHGLAVPLDFQAGAEEDITQAAWLAGIDGAVVVTPQGLLTRFACMLDGSSTGTEVLSRGARFNTAMRYSAAHPTDLLMVVSSDGPLTVFAGGQALYPPPPVNVVAAEVGDVLLEEWLNEHE
jgi:hypothetical protein